MECQECPLRYFVKGIERMVTRGHGCGATGARCIPSEKCEKYVEDHYTKDYFDG